MNRVTFDVQTTFAFLGKIDRYSRDEQLSDCHRAVKELDLPDIGRSIYEHNELTAMLRNLRNNEAVLLPRVDVLAERKGRGIGTRFLTNLLKLTNQTRIIIDVHAGINSHDYAPWYEHVEVARNRLTNTRKPTKDHMKLLGTLRHTKPGIVEHWTKYVDKETFKIHAQCWRDPEHKNAKIARDSFPDEELRKASRKTIERIFGNRTVKRK